MKRRPSLEHGIPIPPRPSASGLAGRSTFYPWAGMTPGSSFTVKCGKKQRKKRSDSLKKAGLYWFRARRRRAQLETRWAAGRLRIWLVSVEPVDQGDAPGEAR